MAGPRQSLRASLSGLLFAGLAIVVAGDPSKAAGITVELQGDRVILHCNFASQGVKTTWKKDWHSLETEGSVLQVGTALDDLRGLYTCSIESGKNESLQVFFRMCQNCIQMDAATLTGLLVASMGATVFLALAVSKIAAQEPGRLSRASDKQTLLANDQLYQPLGERSNGQYSQISLAKPRRPR
ncbi:T-cell surface glycoprotein CD3 delta chain [Tiliqua scincoides]|uniref:T-cell surface glycoprotein CD3 delta chain n=1 Tax=Tiliqua scincoides TaxID=71010 RepID=UPI0034620AB1